MDGSPKKEEKKNNNTNTEPLKPFSVTYLD